MHIYPQEIKDGLADKIAKSRKITLSAKIDVVDECPITVSEKFIDDHFAKAAFKPSPSELFYMTNIVTSSAWNGNDDITLPNELWQCRHTPMHKPLNIEHNDINIIGHTIACMPVNDMYMPIEDDTPEDEIPSFFHLKAGDVIYKKWHSTEFENAIAKMIDEIRNGEWSVSMEAAFSSFDYGLLPLDCEAACKDKKLKSSLMIVPRNEMNSGLTRHLRLFGGSGEYEGFRIGRVMRNIELIGKGVVRHPANPYSIIFSNFNTLYKESVYSNIDNRGDTFMPDELKTLASENALLVKNLAVAEGKLELSVAKENDLKSKIDSLTEDNKSLASAKEALAKEKTELNDKVAKLSKELDEARSNETKASKSVKELETKLSVIDRKVKLASALIDGNVKDAEALADKFVQDNKELSDDIYQKLFDLYVAKLVAESKSAKPKTKTLETGKANLDNDESDTSEENEDESDDLFNDPDKFAEASRFFANDILKKNCKNLFAGLDKGDK